MSSGGRVIAICISERTGTQKQPVEAARLVLGHGVAGDAHAGTWHRQVSLLEQERIDEMRARGLELAPGAFGENIVTGEFDLTALKIGRRLRVGEAVLQVTQLG
jgi:MOSC domain-containing protein YiiM